MGAWSIAEPQRLGFDDDVRRLDVGLVAGRLNVVGTDGPARVEVAAVGTKPLHVELVDGTLSVSYGPEMRRWHPWSEPVWWFMGGRKKYTADVSIAVPRHVAASLRLISGSMVASTLLQGAAVECVSGRVTLLGLAGAVRTKMVSGPVEALGCAGDLWVESVSGEITVADCSATRVHAKTVSGGVICDLDNPKDSEIWLNTISGAITVRVREDSDLEVQLSVAGGRVTSAFAGLVNAGPHHGKNVRGVLGSGAGKLYASAISGNIALLRRPVDDDFTTGEDTPYAGPGERGSDVDSPVDGPVDGGGA